VAGITIKRHSVAIEFCGDEGVREYVVGSGELSDRECRQAVKPALRAGICSTNEEAKCYQISSSNEAFATA